MRTLLVLAGGFGSRLGHLTKDLPTPRVDINGRPFLDYLLDNWFKSNVCNYIFLRHHKGFAIEQFVVQKFSEVAPPFAKAEFIYERNLLGTGGAVVAALPHIHDDEFLITNADTWLPSGLNDMMDAKSPCMAIVKVQNASRFGLVDFSDGKAIRFQEKVDHNSSGYINAGLYLMNKEVFKNLPQDKFDLERTVLRTLTESKSLQIQKISSTFMDIGVPNDLQIFRHEMLSEKQDVL